MKAVIAIPALLGLVLNTNVHAGQAGGPLRVSSANPRYFTDPEGKTVFLTGSHTWGNLQDYRYESLDSPPPMDFKAYLRFLKRHHHNFFRLWAWETAMNQGAKQGSIYYDPLPYLRTGPGQAIDGKPRFDLSRFNPAYFERLRTRVKAAANAGMYVSVMLFNGFSIEGKGNVGGDPWSGHPFNPRNNINGIDGSSGIATHTLGNATVTAYQEAYVRNVIDTVNELDNVLYETSNEDTASKPDTEWQFHMIRFVKSYELNKPRQHPVGMTADWPGSDDILFQSPADWVSPAAKLPVNDGARVILNDTDHSYFWIALKDAGPAAQHAWIWRNFTLGNQCLFMDPYLDPSHDPGRNSPVKGEPDPYWDDLRIAMGQTLKYAQRMDLANAVPHAELASSGFCLADPATEYLVFLRGGGEVSVDLSAAAGPLDGEWMQPAKGSVTRIKPPVQGGSKRSFKAPWRDQAVLYLWSSR